MSAKIEFGDSVQLLPEINDSPRMLVLATNNAEVKVAYLDPELILHYKWISKSMLHILKKFEDADAFSLIN